MSVGKLVPLLNDQKKEHPLQPTLKLTLPKKSLPSRPVRLLRLGHHPDLDPFQHLSQPVERPLHRTVKLILCQREPLTKVLQKQSIAMQLDQK